MDFEKNIYGLSEGVFKACQFLGLKFPAALDGEHVPSDYFGDVFEFDSAMIKKLCADRKWSEKKFNEVYKTFRGKYLSQKYFKHNKTDLNVYFCDYVLFAEKENGALPENYFAFEFYNKSFALRSTFITRAERDKNLIVFKDNCYRTLTRVKSNANKFFADFIRRDWLDVGNCTFDEFKAFVEKHPRFFSKPIDKYRGVGAKIINANSIKSLDELFSELKSQKMILEEIIKQHEALSAFCPDTVNTIRVYTLLDIHNVVHILAASGRFGRTGKFIDNFSGGGCGVIIDTKTGIIISDGINKAHKRIQKHPDTGKTFKGFQYPCWEKLRTTVKVLAKMVPQLRHVGWDIAINDKEEMILVEANSTPDIDIQQMAMDEGKLPLYSAFREETENYKKMEMKLLGYRVNNLPDFNSSYESKISRTVPRLRYLMNRIVPNSASLMDLGCRKEKSLKGFCPANVKYIPVDFQKHDDEVIACNFNEGEFPDVTADVVVCAFTAEFVEFLPQFLNNMCRAAQRQILMLCRPIDKEIYKWWRFQHPFLTDFTEEFLTAAIEQNNFRLVMKERSQDNNAAILYDFRKI